jgi:hypothetical protein
MKQNCHIWQRGGFGPPQTTFKSLDDLPDLTALRALSKKRYSWSSRRVQGASSRRTMARRLVGRTWCGGTDEYLARNRKPLRIAIRMQVRYRIAQIGVSPERR